MTHHSDPIGESNVNESSGGGSAPAWVDWLVGAAIALVGLVLTGVGAALTIFVDRALINDAVVDFGTQSSFLTEAETVDVAVPTVTWTGVGLLAGGLVLLVGAAAYVYYQRKLAKAAGTGRRVGNFRANAVAGGVAALVLSFIPFAQALGGVVAGYLEHDVSGKSTRVGAASGVVGFLPALAIVPFVMYGVYSGAAAIGDQGLGVLVGGVTLAGLVFGAAIAAGLGALGGYAGGIVADDGV